MLPILEKLILRCRKMRWQGGQHIPAKTCWIQISLGDFLIWAMCPLTVGWHVPQLCLGRAAPPAPLITMAWRQEKTRLGKNVETISKTSGEKMSNILFSWIVSLKFKENNCSWKISVFVVLFFLFYFLSHASFWMYFLLFISSLSLVTLYPIPHHRKVQTQQKGKNKYNKEKIRKVSNFLFQRRSRENRFLLTSRS